MLNYFEPSLVTKIIFDASPFGLCASSMQNSAIESERKIVAYASQSELK